MLSEDKLRAAVSVARDLDDSQLAWLSGYFAGLRQGAPTASAAARERPRATILHGSETGNARALAEKTASEWAKAGLAARVLPMSEYKTAQLARERVLLAIVSTHGEGDPPEPARGFFDFAFGKRAPKLDQTKFAVLALGDSSYEHFCRAGIDLDAQFEKLGASRLAPRVDCDVDFDAAAQKWRQQIATKISANGAVNGVAPASLSVVAAPATDVFSRENPATATTVETVLLTAADESRQTWHIELQTPEALVFAPGDSLGVWPQNQPRLVARVAAALGFTGDEEVSLDGETASASEWLSNRLDLARVPPRALLAYGQTRGAGAGERKRGRRFPSGFEAVQRAASGRDWCDILRAYPPVKSNAQAVLASMRRIAPRLYSLANDRETRPGEAHLLVSVSSYDGADGARRGGLCSSFLAGLRADEPARVYAQAAPQFHLPESGSPVVMIGAGTGVAPFRSFFGGARIARRQKLAGLRRAAAARRFLLSARDAGVEKKTGIWSAYRSPFRATARARCMSKIACARRRRGCVCGFWKAARRFMFAATSAKWRAMSMARWPRFSPPKAALRFCRLCAARGAIAAMSIDSQDDAPRANDAFAAEVPAADSTVEKIKHASDGLRGQIAAGLADPHTAAVREDDANLVKFHGIYQQDDRDLRAAREKRKLEPAHSFMIRLRIPGGRLLARQWLALDSIASELTEAGSLRLTNRQTVQFHGVPKENLRAALSACDRVALDSIAACGDVNRNVLCPPDFLSPAHEGVFACARAISDKLLPATGAYREIWLGRERVDDPAGEIDPLYGRRYLPRKFKIALAIPPRNDVDIFANDLGFIAIVKNGALAGFNVAVGGGLGTTFGDARTYARLASVIGFCRPQDAPEVAWHVAALQRDYGDRTDRKVARLKYNPSIGWGWIL